jgi:uncharacterized protein YjdB
VTATWPLQRLEILPIAVTRLIGQRQDYFVRGVFPDGVTRNLTRQVIFASSHPTVAAVSNVPPTRSRVTALKVGTATISATDPISGISTTDSGADATFHVRATISYLVVTSNLRYSSRFPGESQRFTATGYFPDGTAVNLTQKCLWASSDPGVAVAPNEHGDASRIDAVAPGTTLVSCTDWDSGKSSAVPFWVLGELQEIRLHGGPRPLDFPPIGGSIALSAIGRYAGGGERNKTQEVVWATRDPEIALCPNTPGDRSRITSVGGGDARIYATDAASGVVSQQDYVVPMLGELVQLRVRAPFPYYEFDAIPVGSETLFDVVAQFDHGNLPLARAGAEYVLESSDPSVAEIVSDRYVRAVAPGTFELTARDLATGTVSPPFTVTVMGALDHITLTPATATRGIGEWESFTAIGVYPPGIEELLTQRLTYASSDPNVAVIDVGGPRSRVRTVGQGTATITAMHAETGTTATATITVLPGAIERVSVVPENVVRNVGNDFSFTAIGHYPDGSTINVTQVVTWVSHAPHVARTSNEAGDRSRVVAEAPGTATITAHHPSGVSSHDTGDDGTFVAKELVALTLGPASHIGPVGMTEEYTLIGTFDDASTINLTQDAYYWVEDPLVARPDNREGNRSAVELLAPGSTTVHATFADWTTGYPVTSGGEATASLAVRP